MIEFLDLDAVITYALRLETATTVARVGVFLEQHRQRLFVEDAHLEATEGARPEGPALPSTRRESPGRLVHPWNLIVPERCARPRAGVRWLDAHARTTSASRS